METSPKCCWTFQEDTSTCAQPDLHQGKLEIANSFQTGERISNRTLDEIFTPATEISEQIVGEMLPMNQHQGMLQIPSWHDAQSHFP